MDKVKLRKRAHSELSNVSENDSSRNITPTKIQKRIRINKKKEDESTSSDINENAIKDIKKAIKADL